MRSSTYYPKVLRKKAHQANFVVYAKFSIDFLALCGLKERIRIREISLWICFFLLVNEKILLEQEMCQMFCLRTEAGMLMEQG